MFLLSLGTFVGCTSHEPDSTAHVSAPDPEHGSPPVLKSAVLPRAAAAAVPPAITPVFPEVSRQAGVDFTFFSDIVPGRYLLPETMGGGVAWIDFDNDGWLDLCVTNGCRLGVGTPEGPQHASRLFRNRRDGTFTDVTGMAAIDREGYGQGCAVGDFDCDGFPDLYFSNYGPDTLLRNNGDGTFMLHSQAAGITDHDWGSSAAWFDADGDGDLDVYVVNYLAVTVANNKTCMYFEKPGYCGPGQFEASPDFLYLNEGDGTFIESSTKLGVTGRDGKGLALAVLDLDDDLKPEIYVANDMTANFLFSKSAASLSELGIIPQSDRYSEAASLAGCAASDNGEFEASMGIACADFDKNGRPDIYLTHYYNQKNTLYRNLGKLVFMDDSRRTRAAATSFALLGFGTVAFDYDRDGWSDLVVANGHVLGPIQNPNEMQPQLLRNDGTGRFDDISQFAGTFFSEAVLGRGIGSADYDNDGDLDFAVTHIGRSLGLLRNDTTTHRSFVGLELRTHSRIPPIGGRVVVTYGKEQTVMPIVAGGSYLSSSDTRLLFGLADLDEPVQVVVHWPSGRVDEFSEVQIDRYWRITEGGQPELLRLSEASMLQ